MMSLVKVNMTLSDRDAENAHRIMDLLHLNSKANAVSHALTITAKILDIEKRGGEILVRDRDGSMERIVVNYKSDYHE